MNFINRPIKNLPKEERIEKVLGSHNDEIESSSQEYVEDNPRFEKDRSETFDHHEKRGRRYSALDVLIFLQTLLIFSLSIGLVYYAFLLTGYGMPVQPLVAVNRNETISNLKDDRQIFPFFEGGISPKEMEEIEASSFIAFNPATFQIYTSSNIESKRAIASITKLMSAITSLRLYEKTDLLQAKDLSDTRLEWLLGLEEGDLISYEDLMKAMLINSYNDAAYVVAQNHPGGQTEFIAEMNKMASMLGMDDSKFENPAGLDHPDNYSSVKDIKRLAMLAIKTPEIMEIVKLRSDVITIYRPIPVDTDITVSQPEIPSDEGSGYEPPIYPSEKGLINKEQLDLSSYEEVKVNLKTTNELLDKREGMLGLKTGYTSDAGPSFVGYLYGSEDDQLITIILDAQGNRFDETEDLIDLIRSNF